MIFTVLLLGRLWACVGNRALFTRAVYRPVWRRRLVARRFLRGPLVSVSGEKPGRHRT